nr:hypothetical protein [Desulfuromonadales bacterium]
SIGRRCNAYTVLYNLSRLGWQADEATVQKIVSAVRSRMSERTGYALMTEEEFKDLVLNGGFQITEAGPH